LVLFSCWRPWWTTAVRRFGRSSCSPLNKFVEGTFWRCQVLAGLERVMRKKGRRNFADLRWSWPELSSEAAGDLPRPMIDSGIYSVGCGGWILRSAKKLVFDGVSSKVFKWAGRLLHLRYGSASRGQRRRNAQGPGRTFLSFFVFPGCFVQFVQASYLWMFLECVRLSCILLLYGYL
jgi:hypothetical protein